MRLNSRKKNSNFWLNFLVFLLLIPFIYVFQDEIFTNYLFLRDKVTSFFAEKEKLLKENKILKDRILNLNIEKRIQVRGQEKFVINQDQNFENKINKKTKPKEEGLKNVSYKSYFSKNKYYLVLNENNLFEGKILNNHKNKIKVGDKVYFEKNILYGFVTKVDNNFISVRNITDYNYENNFLIFINDKVIYRGRAKGISNGLIEFGLPREIEGSKKAILILDDGSADIVGEFYKEEFKKQESKRRVYFRLFKNPYTVYQVEI